MPYLNVKLCTSSSPELSAKIATTLTELTAELLKKNRKLTAVVVEYVRPADWFIGGTSLSAQSQCSFYLDIKVTEGTNTKDERAAYVSRVFSIMEALLGNLNPASYVVIHDVRGDSWGVPGETQEFRLREG